MLFRIDLPAEQRFPIVIADDHVSQKLASKNSSVRSPQIDPQLAQASRTTPYIAARAPPGMRIASGMPAVRQASGCTLPAASRTKPKSTETNSGSGVLVGNIPTRWESTCPIRGDSQDSQGAAPSTRSAVSAIGIDKRFGKERRRLTDTEMDISPGSGNSATAKTLVFLRGEVRVEVAGAARGSCVRLDQETAVIAHDLPAVDPDIEFAAHDVDVGRRNTSRRRCARRRDCRRRCGCRESFRPAGYCR